MRARVLGGCLAAALAGACAYDRPTLSDRGDDAAAPDAAGADTPGPDGEPACATDDQCPSGICEATGCVAVDAISYISTMGDDRADCSAASPCATLATALTAQLDRGASVLQVVVEPGAYGPQRFEFPGSAMRVVGRRSALGDVPTIRAARSSFTVVTGSQLELRSLAVETKIQDVFEADPLPVLVRCESGGRVVLREAVISGYAETVPGGLATDDVVQLNSCDGVIERSRLGPSGGYGLKVTGAAAVVTSSAIVDNNDGGVLTVGATSLAITGTVIARNGTSTSGLGGASLEVAGPLVFAWNTVADNDSGSDNSRALVCEGVSRPVRLVNNLVTASQWKSSCLVADSIVTGVARADTDGSNRIVTLGQVGYADEDYHLSASSVARGTAVAAPGIDPGLDVDGEPRPQGAFDVGADEIP